MDTFSDLRKLAVVLTIRAEIAIACYAYGHCSFEQIVIYMHLLAGKTEEIAWSWICERSRRKR